MRKLIFILIALVSFSQAQTIQYIGAPTTTVISRGNFRTDSIFYLPKRTKTPTDTAAFRYQISDSSLYYWTGYQWMKVGNNQDTASMLSNYVRGSGTTNYFPKFNSTRSIVDSKLYESNLNLLFNTTTPYVTTSGISTIENNGTSAALYVLKTLDTARAYVSFGGANTMDINNLRAGDIRFYTNATLRGRFQTDGTFRLNSLTGTGSRIVVADDNGVLSATSSATGLVDTTLLSTRAYRQKGDDSLGAIIATKGSGTVTSVATGYGLSGGTITTTGTLIADTLNLSTRAWRQKGLDSLAALEISGSGSTNYIPKYINAKEIGVSNIFDNGTNIGVNTPGPLYAKFQINASGAGLQDALILENTNSAAANLGTALTFAGVGTATQSIIRSAWGGASINDSYLSFLTKASGSVSERFRVSSSGELLINTTTDAGAYTLQNNGALYNTGSAILAATSGSVGIGNTDPKVKLDVNGSIRVTSSNTPTSGEGIEFQYASNQGEMLTYDRTGSAYTPFRLRSSTVKIYGGGGAGGIDINSSGETLFGTTTDAGNYRVQVSGNAYVTGDAILAASSGGVQAGTLTTNSNYVIRAGRSNSSVGDNIINTVAHFSNTYNNNTNGNIAYPVLSLERVGASGISNNSLFEIGLARYDTINTNAFTQVNFIVRDGISTSRSTLATFSNATITFRTSDTERIRIHSNGGLKYVPQSAAPTAEAGTVYYDSDDNKLKVYNGTTWVDLH